jgi:salicylate hydroxylase
MVSGKETSSKDKKDTTIAVVGGGIGGILTAIGLGRQGYKVHLFEQALKFSEIGAGIAMWVTF